MRYIRTVLAGESRSDDAFDLVRCLKALGLKIHVATSVGEAMSLLRRELFDAAVLGVEMDADGESMIARVSRLTAAGLLMTTGPGGDWELERRARLAGAAVYLPRPVSAESLTEAFRECAGGFGEAAEPLQVMARQFQPP